MTTDDSQVPGERELPAFPTQTTHGYREFQTGNATWHFPGMTLRDYFAAKAMQGMLTTAGAPCLNGLDGYEDHSAEAAYKLADAMLKARRS